MRYIKHYIYIYTCSIAITYALNTTTEKFLQTDAVPSLCQIKHKWNILAEADQLAFSIFFFSSTENIEYKSFINLRLVQKLDLNYDLPFTFHYKMWRSCICSISSLCDDIYIECASHHSLYKVHIYGKSNVLIFCILGSQVPGKNRKFKLNFSCWAP